MPRHSRRALLSLLGSGTATLLAGCQDTSPGETLSERSTKSASSTETATPTENGMETETETVTRSEGTTHSASPTETSTATARDPETETDSETPTGTLDAADCAAVPRPEAAWPVPRRSPARDSYVADSNGFETAPSSAWVAEPTAPEDSYASPSYGQPVVAGDSLYVTNELNKGPEQRKEGHVHALDTETGDRQWASERLWSPSHPVAWKDLAVVVAEDEGFNTMVVAYDRPNGTRQWTRKFAARENGFVTAGDHLYLALEADSDHGTITALADDGSTVWSHENAFADHVNERPAVGTDNVYVASRDGRLHARARDDGTETWIHKFEHPTEQRPYVTDIVATTCSVITVVEGAVKAFDDDGALVWKVDGDHGTLTTDGETLYVVDLDGDGKELRALNAATGEIRWTVKPSGTAWWPEVVANDAIYMRFNDGIAALDPTDGTERWRTSSSLDDIALVDGTLYGTSQETLQAFR